MAHEAQMRVYRAQEGVAQASLQLIDIPALGPLDVLIKVVSAGLSPGIFTLLKAGRLSHMPITLGAEAAGIVEKIGDHVTNINVGMRVRVHSSLSCRSCKYCLSNRDQMCREAGVMGFSAFSRPQTQLFDRYHDGCLAEYVRAPCWLVDELPDNVSFDVGAKLPEIATAYHSLREAHLQPQSTVVVTAPTGAVGVSIIKLASLFGIGRLVLVGRSTERLEAVVKLTSVTCNIVGYDQLGDDWASTQALARKLSELLPEGADALIDLVPAGANGWQALAGLGTNGRFVHLGANSAVLPLPMVAIMTKCWEIVGIRGHSRADALIILAWLRDGKLHAEDLITHRWKFDEVESAVGRLQDRSLASWMIVVNM